MPFDGAFAYGVVKELSNLIDCRIDKIHQPSRDEIILIFKKERKTVKMLFSANPSYPRVHITEQNKENPSIPPTFCMMLRKHLLDGRIVSINQINFDRIIELTIESKDELGYPTTYYLVAEIMGKHSNIILLNSERKIVDCIKHIGSNINRYREVLPGSIYILPPIKEKINPLLVEKKEIQNILSENSNKSLANIILDKFLGISKPLSKEICGKYQELTPMDLTPMDREILISCFFYFISKIKSCSFLPTIYYDPSGRVDYYIFPLEQYNNYITEYHDTPGKLLDIYYSQRDLKDTLKQKYHDLFKLVSNIIERNNKKIQIYISNIEECSNLDTWKIYGDLIMSYQYNIKAGMDEIEVENFYHPEMEKVKITLDKDLSAVENAQKYYKKYTKEKKTIEMSSLQLKECKEEQIYLDSIICNLENASDIATIEEIKNELFESGYIKKKKKNLKQQKSSPYHYKSRDGFDIYVGKNNHQNDFLTTKFAVGSDIWMHTKNIPGSHVIIKSQGGYVSDDALLEGAKLAAYYSKAKNSTNVPVDYTERKNVKKPSGAKPGMVIYFTNRTIYVTPDEKYVNELKNI